MNASPISGCITFVVGILSAGTLLILVGLAITALTDPTVSDAVAGIIIVAAVAIAFTMRDIFGNLIKALFGK